MLAGYAHSRFDANCSGIGPIYSIQKYLEMTGLTFKDMDVITLNKAFQRKLWF